MPLKKKKGMLLFQKFPRKTGIQRDYSIIILWLQGAFGILGCITPLGLLAPPDPQRGMALHQHTLQMESRLKQVKQRSLSEKCG